MSVFLGKKLLNGEGRKGFMNGSSFGMGAVCVCWCGCGVCDILGMLSIYIYILDIHIHKSNTESYHIYVTISYRLRIQIRSCFLEPPPLQILYKKYKLLSLCCVNQSVSIYVCIYIYVYMYAAATKKKESVNSRIAASSREKQSKQNETVGLSMKFFLEKKTQEIFPLHQLHLSLNLQSPHLSFSGGHCFLLVSGSHYMRSTSSCLSPDFSA